jgi:multisubunit Na+/H+ antiporter MnhG subunit
VNFPLALLALAMLAVVGGHLPRGGRIVAIVAAVCCAVFAVPGVVRQSNLDARWINAVPALGVGIALACSLLAQGLRSPRRAQGDRLRVALAAILVLLTAPWIAAQLGFYLDGVPVLGWLFQTSRIVSFHDAPHPAVHHGVHHGLQGLLLVLTALLLSRLLSGQRRPPEQARALLLSLVLAYGLGNIANDAWLEQVTERGWSRDAIPSVLGFTANWLWLAVLVTAAVVWLAWFGRPPRPTDAP